MSILKKPLLTEKSIAATADNRFTFIVDPKATKHQIKSEVESLFKVNVVRVNIQNRARSVVRSGRTGRYQTSKATKKAVVQLKPKQTINLFEIK